MSISSLDLLFSYRVDFVEFRMDSLEKAHPMGLYHTTIDNNLNKEETRH